MYYIFGFVCAAVIALMVVLNGNLTTLYQDVFVASIIIHAVGLIISSILIVIRKEKLHIKKAIPFGMYLGGLIGVGTTVFNNAAYGKISVSAILALGLLAQAITSLVIDHFGLFHMPVRKFSIGKLIGILFTLGGITLLFHGAEFVFVPVVLSILTGVTVVTSRSVNAELTEVSSVCVSTWYNFAVGLLTCIVLWVSAVLLGKSSFEIHLQMNSSKDLISYAGGVLGVVTISLLNIVVKKLPAFILTLMMFTGQLFTGVIIDYFLGESITVTYCMGGVLTVFGLCFNLYLDRKKVVSQTRPVLAEREGL